MRGETDNLPESIQRWLSALDGRGSWETLNAQVSPELVYELAGRKTRGVETVLAQMAARPRVLNGVLWRLVAKGPARDFTLRATSPKGLLQGAGGPMSALDFLFRLDEHGRIVWVSPRPHHVEPTGLRTPIPVGALAPAFQLPDANGHLHSIAWESSAATLVIFTCNHCPWALAWHQRLQQVARDYQPRAVQTVQINANDPQVSAWDALERSRERVAAGDFATPLLIDARQVVARLWGARHTPELFVVDNAGRVAYHGAADADSEDERLAAVWVRTALDEVLGKVQVTRANSAPVGCTIKWTL